MSISANQTYNKVDNYFTWKPWKWAKRQHPKKSNDRIRQQYWRTIGNRHHEFATDKMFLKRCSDTPIVRHSLAKLDANPYTNGDYFENKAKGAEACGV